MLGLSQPHTFELVGQRMATVMTDEGEDCASSEAVAALYASVNAVRARTPFDLEPLRARRVIDGGRPKSQRGAMWGIPVPPEVTEIPCADERYPVRIETWEYGTVAEILHEGSRAEEARTVDRLKRYMREQKLEPVGAMEEEYLTVPGAAVPRTLIRFRVRPA
jgi:hypothetical protein